MHRGAWGHAIALAIQILFAARRTAACLDRTGPGHSSGAIGGPESNGASLRRTFDEPAVLHPLSLDATCRFQ